MADFDERQLRKDFEQFQKKQEKERQKEQLGNIASKSLAAVAAVGIGIVGYQHKNQLLDIVSNKLGKTSVSLARTASGTKFQGKLTEFKNLNKAFEDTYGNANPMQVIQNLNNRKKKSEQFYKRIAYRNGENLADVASGIMPADIQQTRNILTGSRNDAMAFEEASRSVLGKVLSQDKYKDAFGENLNNVERVLNSDKSLFKRDFEKTLKRKDIASDGIPKPFIDLFKKYNINEQATINFGIKDEEAQVKFVRQMMDTVTEVQERTKKQVDDFGNGAFKDNDYAKYKHLYDYTEFAGLRKAHVPGKSLFDKSFDSQGFRPVTMGEAQDLYVVRDAGTDKIRLSDKNNENARQLQTLFDPRIKHANSVSLASDYIGKGRRAGFAVDDLKKDVFSNNVRINPKTGEIINTSGLSQLGDDVVDYLQSNYQVPIIKVNPIDLTKRHYLKQQAAVPKSMVYQSGTIHSLVDDQLFAVDEALDVRNKDAVGRLKQSYIHIDDTIYDGNVVNELDGLTPEEVVSTLGTRLDDYRVADGYSIMDSSQGQLKLMAETYSRRTNTEPILPKNNKERAMAMFKDIWGFNSDEESNFTKTKKWYEHFEAYDGPDNILTSFTDSLYSHDVEGASEIINKIDYKLSARITPLSTDSSDVLREDLVSALNKVVHSVEGPIAIEDLDTEEGIFRVAEKIAKTKNGPYRDGENISKDIENHARQKIVSVYNHNKDNPDDYLSKKRFLKSQGGMGDVIQNDLGEVASNQITMADEMRRMIEQYAISVHDAENKYGNLTNKVYQSHLFNPDNVIDELDALRAQNAVSYFNSKQQGALTVGDLSNAQIRYQSTFFGEHNIGESTQRALHKAEPWYVSGIDEEAERILGDTYFTPMKTYKNPLDLYLEGKEKGISDAVKSSLRQGDFLFNGLDGTPNTSNVVPWNIFNNLDKRLQDVGLGLRNDLKRSPMSIMLNQFGRRIVLPYAIYQQAQWANDMLLGGEGDKFLAGTYANMHMGLSGVKEALGINEFGRNIQETMPWAEHIGAWAPVNVFNDVTFGAFNDFRSPEEVEEYYQSGEDAIRSGRYWGMGSSGAWMGGRIDRYEPNWYRKIMSDYEYTEDMYGSAREYWANNWMPTLSHPLAPIKHFITDPYHWENKHALSRPYAATGGFAEIQAWPVIGPLMDGVISGILKPRRINPRLKGSHENYQNEYYSGIIQDYLNVNTGGMANLNPGGGAVLASDYYAVSHVDEDGRLDGETLETDAIRWEVESARIQQALVNNAGPIKGYVSDKLNLGQKITSITNALGQGLFGSSDYASEVLGQYNNIKANQKPQRVQNVSQAGRYDDPTMPTDLNSVYNPNDIFSRHGAGEGVFDSLFSFAGLYGFAGKTAIGFDIDDERNRYLETSDNFMDYAQKFWDMELGGLGGDLSEIGRRYLDDDARQNYYNPIKNEMPSWLPGQEYFIDFKHGDPFNKVDKGIMRLPGEA